MNGEEWIIHPGLNITGVILAGGSNRRYPTLKGLVEFRGRRLIERVIDALGIFEDIIIITNRPEAYFYLGLPMYGDVVDFRCPLSGIYTALLNIDGDILVSACDMPLINRSLVEMLRKEAVERLSRFDAIVPIFNGKPQPLLSAYSRRILPAVEEWLRLKRCNMGGFLKEIKTYYLKEELIREIDPKGLSFININTPEDKEMAEGII